ncbi:hypothetical protein PG997_013835 [Apiospora hydei]|uniref:Stc1 domain-containing protein n=1 Tax=Apiospora hydei TaxID=1337664 RepID=A0ABR1V7F7_9PEZI
MCKQYVYLSLCLEHDCDAVVGKKGRNTYCQAARRGARRLASCDGGLEYVIMSRHRGTVVCDECKQLRTLRQLYSASLLLAATTKRGKREGKGGCTPTTATAEGSLLSDDGSASSLWETIEYDDEEDEEADGDAEALCFFANKKLKAEKLASAYDFDLALTQEIAAAALNREWLHAEDRRDEYLAVTCGRDDSTIEYEVKVPESTRRKGQGPLSYYGFKSLDKKELMALRRKLQLQCAAQGVIQGNTRQKSDDAWYDSDTTTATAVMTPSESEGSEVEMNMNNEVLRPEFNKEPAGSETTSRTARDADHESEDEVEINNGLHFELRPEFLHRNCADRIGIDGRDDVKIMAPNLKRGILPEVEPPLATGETSLSTDEDDMLDDWNAEDEEKEKKGPEYGGKDDDDNVCTKKTRTLPSYFDVVLADGGCKKRRTY